MQITNVLIDRPKLSFSSTTLKLLIMLVPGNTFQTVSHFVQSHFVTTAAKLLQRLTKTNCKNLEKFRKSLIVYGLIQINV